MNRIFDSVGPYLSLLGRVLIAAIFILSGVSKVGGIAIVAGAYTRIVALLLAGFCILTGLLFHAGSPDQTQQIMFMKNLGLAGGFLFLVASGPGRLSVDRFLRKDDSTPGGS